MSDESQSPAFPTYQPPNPQGIPLSPHPKHASVLMKAIKNLGKISSKASRGKNGLRNKSGVRIGRGKKTVWY